VTALTDRAAADGGYVLLARKLAARDGWPVQLRAEHFKFMVLLLLRARWRDGDYLAPGGTVIKIKRGQYASPTRRMAAEFNLPRYQVRAATAVLSRTGFLTQEVTHGVTVITIRNYERYQDISNYVNPASRPSSSRGSPTTRPLKKESNEGNEGLYKKIFDAWNSHPKIFPKHRRLTDAMRRAISARLRDFAPDRLVEAIQNYGDSDEPFWREWRETKSGWSLDQFLSRGEGAKVDKFLAGPIKAAKPRYSGAVNPGGRKFIK
jgi:hypothetical protein